MKSTTRWGGIFLCGIGVGLLVASPLIGLNTWRFKQVASRTQGAVIRESYGCHHVDVRFRTVSGETIDYPQNGDICLHTGQQVPVLYDPSMPRMTATVDSAGALWGVTFWVGVVGLIFFVGSILTLSGSRFVVIRQGRW